MRRDPDRPRPDWHMRKPFALAYLALVVIGFIFDWRFGLLLLVWLPLAYLSRKLVRRLWTFSLPSGSRSD